MYKTNIIDIHIYVLWFRMGTHSTDQRVYHGWWLIVSNWYIEWKYNNNGTSDENRNNTLSIDYHEESTTGILQDEEAHTSHVNERSPHARTSIMGTKVDKEWMHARMMHTSPSPYQYIIIVCKIRVRLAQHSFSYIDDCECYSNILEFFFGFFPIF